MTRWFIQIFYNDVLIWLLYLLRTRDCIHSNSSVHVNCIEIVIRTKHCQENVNISEIPFEGVGSDTKNEMFVFLSATDILRRYLRRGKEWACQCRPSINRCSCPWLKIKNKIITELVKECTLYVCWCVSQNFQKS